MASPTSAPYIVLFSIVDTDLYLERYLADDNIQTKVLKKVFELFARDTQRARKFKKVQAKILVKLNKSIFLVKLHFF